MPSLGDAGREETKLGSSLNPKRSCKGQRNQLERATSASAKALSLPKYKLGQGAQTKGSKKMRERKFMKSPFGLNKKSTR